MLIFLTALWWQLPAAALAPAWVQAQSVEEARRRRDHLAKMRSLLFHQEAKLKHLAKIKSKDYHRRAQKAARAKARLSWALHPAWMMMTAHRDISTPDQACRS